LESLTQLKELLWDRQDVDERTLLALEEMSSGKGVSVGSAMTWLAHLAVECGPVGKDDYRVTETMENLADQLAVPMKVTIDPSFKLLRNPPAREV
jgi:hypothetical protein